MLNTVGHRTTELSLQYGIMYASADALKTGLVDQLVPEEEVLTTATEIMTKWLAIPGQEDSGRHALLYMATSIIVFFFSFLCRSCPSDHQVYVTEADDRPTAGKSRI